MEDNRHESLNYEQIKLLETFFMNSHDGIFIVSKEGEVLLANPAILNLLGSSYEELVGIKVTQILEAGIYKGSPALEVYKTKKPFTGLVKARNGTEIMSTSKPVFNKDNELELIITNCRPLSVIESFYKQYNIHGLNKKNQTEPYTPNLEREFIYGSPTMQQLMKEIALIAHTDSTIIIYGQTGTGKGLIARYIHEKSPRRNGKFIEINCAAIPENLIESELFGYEKGAFTGANSNGKLGLFEIAHGGTIFLDEIGEMPLHLQTKLLKVLDAGYILRLGGTVYHKVNARVIVATNKNLKKLVKEGKFREDLYYRLNVFPITVPSLRDRKEDIPLLSQKILEELNYKYNTQKRINQETIIIFENYDWPGNVRQLRNIIERLYILCGDDELNLKSSTIRLDDYDIYDDKTSAEEKGEIAKSRDPNQYMELPLKEYMNQMEKYYIEKILQQCGGSVAEASKKIGIHRTSLYKKLNEMGTPISP